MQRRILLFISKGEAHEHLAVSVKDGKLLAAEYSAHMIPDDQPEIIVEAVAELVHVVQD